MANNSLYTFDVNKFTSIHHGKKTDDTSFCGDKLKDDVNEKLPKSYKYFYDDEIQKMVETIYEKDIKYYGYDFDDLIKNHFTQKYILIFYSFCFKLMI